jgi:chromosome segregation ATPase
LKANTDAAALLNFLRNQVANPGFRDYLSAQEGALTELKHHITHKKHHALSAIAKHHMLALLQQDGYSGEDDLHYDQRARTDEEIGSGHHDNDRAGMTTQSFTIDARNLDDFIAELLGFIDGLIEQINADNASLAANEFAAVEDLIAYQDQIEQEAIVLNLYIGQWSAHIDELSATIEQNEQASAECHDRLEYLNDSLANDQAAYETEFAAFEERRDSVQHTIGALDEVIEVYASKVAGAAEEYKREYDEEIDAKERADTNNWDNSAEEEFFVQRRHSSRRSSGKGNDKP